MEGLGVGSGEPKPLAHQSLSHPLSLPPTTSPPVGLTYSPHGLVSQTTQEKIPWEGEFTIRSDP